ncbi:MAG: AEC family transporter, partial [Rhodobacteraceae bacterium]|nr:AEC family transporter [Paracoccaceae bacterium]
IATTSLVLHPLISWILSAFIFALETDLVRSAVITAAMAPGINAYIFSSMYKRAQRVVAASVLLATGLSVFTASIWLWLMA